MMPFAQGDIIRITGYKYRFLVISKNSFIRATGVFHVCPLFTDAPVGPLHIPVSGKKQETGTVLCEQLKLIDPEARSCSKIDSIPYAEIMDISDAVQGIFEYD